MSKQHGLPASVVCLRAAATVIAAGLADTKFRGDEIDPVLSAVRNRVIRMLEQHDKRGGDGPRIVKS